MPIRFASGADERLAGVFAVLFLQKLVRYFERGLTELGLTIERRVTLLGDGIASPVIVAKNEAWTLQLGLRHLVTDLKNHTFRAVQACRSSLAWIGAF